VEATRGNDGKRRIGVGTTVTTTRDEKKKTRKKKHNGMTTQMMKRSDRVARKTGQGETTDSQLAEKKKKNLWMPPMKCKKKKEGKDCKTRKEGPRKIGTGGRRVTGVWLQGRGNVTRGEGGFCPYKKGDQNLGCTEFRGGKKERTVRD